MVALFYRFVIIEMIKQNISVCIPLPLRGNLIKITIKSLSLFVEIFNKSLQNKSEYHTCVKHPYNKETLCISLH